MRHLSIRKFITNPLRYLLAEKKFSQVHVFEQRATAGGVWNHTPITREDDDFTVPRITPTRRPDQAIYTENSDAAQFLSPVYDFLETNIPHVLMNYSDQKFPEGSSLFPPHRVVLEYLREYAEELKPCTSFSAQVLGVRKVKSGDEMCWEVETKDLKTKQTRKQEFDAVAVASGHYNDPFIPDIPGLKEFDEKYPGAISHSKFYRRPDHYDGKKVIVVGNSASGIDLSAQIASVAKLPVLISEKEKAAPVLVVQEDKPWANNVQEIVEFMPGERSVRFANDEVQTEVDSVVFCTGYHYSFPFLKGLEPSVVVSDGSHAAHLWEHILYTADPTLAFLSIPQRIVPFPVSEAQSALIARIWSDRLRAPTPSEMTSWVDELRKDKGDNKTLHNLAFPEDVHYINRLHDLSVTAKKVSGLENDGKGKTPIYWGKEKEWTRERFPMIKLASRALGEQRHELRSLKELGFDYEDWRKQKEVAERLL